MTDLLRKDLISPAAAARLLPSRPHASTVWRWHLRGIKGVRLKTLVVGGRRYTTAAFLEDFVARLSDPGYSASPSGSRRRAAEEARAAARAVTTA